MRIFDSKVFPITVLSLLFICSVYGETRPKIGLALSGGGAKGFAHIGVLKVLEQEDLPIDYVTGTSVGAIVAGLYAIGYSASELEEIVLNTNWTDMFTDNIGRRALAMELKRWDGRYLASLPIRNKKVQLPSGLIAGQKFSRLLARLTLSVHNIDDFSTFPIPFACVATDIVTGEPVVLNSGFLPEALRASMAIPSIFTPIKIAGHLLVDGGLVRNFPVEDVRTLGADFMIGVDVSEPLHREEELNSFVNIFDQALRFMSVSSTLQQRELCDILIVPDITGLSTLNFSNVAETIERGEKAARDALPQIRAIADSLAPFANSVSHDPPMQSDSIFVRNLTIQGLHKISQRIVDAELEITTPTWLTLHDIEKATDRVYSTQFFERVTYKVEPGERGSSLVIKVVEKSEDLFRFGLRYNSDTEASVLLNTSFRNIAQSSFLNLDSNLGEQIEFDAQYFFYSGLRSSLGFSARMNYLDSFVDVFNESRREARLDVKSAFAEGLFGTIFSTKIAVATGFRVEHVEGSEKIAPADTLSFDQQMLSFLNIIWLDTFDRANFATSGLSVLIRNELAIRNLGSETSFTRHYFDLRGRIPVSPKISLLGEIMAGGSRGGEPPTYYQFILGGLNTPVFFANRSFANMSFVGLKYQELIGRYAQFAQVGMQVEVWPRIFFLFRANAGNTFDEWKIDFAPGRFESGFGITIGAATPLGPVEFNLMSGSRHDFLTHLNVGYKF